MKIKHSGFLILLIIAISVLSCKKDTIVNPPNNDENVELPEIRWKSGEEIIIKTDFYVDEARLIIEPGVTVKIKNGCSIIIGENYYADITAIGTVDKPINFLPYNSGNIENPYWGGIRIIRNPFSESNTIFEYCNFIKGGEGAEAVIYSENGKFTINNCLIEYSKGYGIKTSRYPELLGFSGNTIKHTLNHPIWTTLKNAGKIGKTNVILSDSINRGILVEHIGHGNDTIVWYNHGVPYVVSGILNPKGSNKNVLNFTVEKGATIAFEKNSSMEIGPKTVFNAVGTGDEPIVFTSNQIEKQAGDWKNISFYSDAPIWLDNCIFEYGGDSDPYMPNDNGILVVHGPSVSIKNSLIQHSASSGVDLFSQSQKFPNFVDFKGNTFNDLNGYAVTLFPQSIFSLEKENDYGDFGVYVKESEFGSGTHLWKNNEKCCGEEQHHSPYKQWWDTYLWECNAQF